MRNSQRMAETAAHLADPFFPRLAVRQWALSVQSVLRYFMQRNRPLFTLSINEIEAALLKNTPSLNIGFQ